MAIVDEQDGYSQAITARAGMPGAYTNHRARPSSLHR